MSTLSTTNLKNPSAGSNNIVLGTDGSTRVTTLADSAGANTSTPAEIASGRAKAWVNFNGTGTVAIRASYNVSSITDNGTGDYTVNFTTALADANYAANVTGTRFTSGTIDGDFRATVAGTDYFLAGSIRVIFYNTTGIASTSDAPAMCVSIFR
jgi:hypothetical protein